MRCGRFTVSISQSGEHLVYQYPHKALALAWAELIKLVFFK